MHRPEAKTPSHVVEAFEAEFLAAYVESRRMLSGAGLAVFADHIKLVPNNAVLFGGADFVRFKVPNLMPAPVLRSSLEAGGRDHLLKMVQLLQSGDRSYKQAKKLQKVSLGFRTLLERAESTYWLAQVSPTAQTVH